MKNLGMLHQTDIPAFTDSVASLVLAAGTGQAVDVPSGAGFVAFTSSVDFWVRYGSTGAAIPTTSTTAGSSAISAFNPDSRNLTSTAACSVISLVSASSGYVVLEFWHV